MSTTPLLEEIEGLLANLHDNLTELGSMLRTEANTKRAKYIRLRSANHSVQVATALHDLDQLASALRRARDKIAELEQDGERLDAAETLFESFMCWKFLAQPITAGNDWTNAPDEDEPEIHGNTLRELIDNLVKHRAAIDQARRADGGGKGK